MSPVLPSHYDIRIEPDFSNFTFSGLTSIHLTAQEPVSKVTLNAIELEIESCKLVKGKTKKNLSFKMDYASEEMHIDMSTEISGKFTIEFKYKGKIEENLKGLYKTKYKVVDEEHYGALTQFETEDARRMFPCFDEPGIKATFALEVIINNDFTVISNTPVLSDKKVKATGKRTVKFQKTPKMSTYLLFLGIAEFESINSKQGEIDVSVFTHPGSIQFGTDSLEFGKKALDYCQTYFDIPYPLPKLDLIATPEFSQGAMENWGAISFREDYLLTFPGSTTREMEIYILEVISHEISHQWFGNLVSPSIWKYIWLNESFANFFGKKVVDHYRPELNIWEYYVPDNITPALLSDSYLESVPIEIKNEKKTSFNLKSTPIIYNKGEAILRMVETFIGSDAFQKGIQSYLKEHAYDAASSDDLWKSLEKYSDFSISDLMKTWILQMGYPLLTIVRNGTKFTFTQERFTMLENKDKSIWMVPISILLFSKGKIIGEEKFLLTKKEQTLSVKKKFDSYKINPEHTGFYRVKYPQEDIAVLGEMIEKIQLSTIDAWNLINDISSLLIAGKIELDYFLDFILHFNSEKYYSSIQIISEILVRLYNLAPEGDKKNIIINAGTIFHETFLEKIHLEPQESESFTIANLRNILLRNAGHLGSKKAIDFGMEQFNLLKENKSISPDILDAVLFIGANQTNDLDWFIHKFDTAKNEVEIINYGTNLASMSDVKILTKVIDELAFKKIPQRNQPWLVMRLCQNPVATANSKMWKFFLANLDYIGKVNDYFQQVFINVIITNIGVEQEDLTEMKKFFKTYNKTNQYSAVITDRSFETVEINLGIKSRLA